MGGRGNDDTQRKSNPVHPDTAVRAANWVNLGGTILRNSKEKQLSD
jgi:hypothetical protein